MKVEFNVYGNAVSENVAYNTNPRIRRRFLVEKGRAWKNNVAWCGKKAIAELYKSGIIWDKEKKYHIDLVLSFNDNRARDDSNYEKLIFDALQGIFYLNDTQKTSHSCEMVKGEPHVNIKIRYKE